MQQLIAQLNHPELRQRLEAAAQLMKGGQKSVDSLLDALNHAEVEIRWRAAAALGWIGDARAIPALVKRGDGEGYEGKFNIVWALGQIGDAAAIQPLLAIVHAEESESPDIRYNAALALARLGQADRLRQSLEGSPEAVYRVAHAALAAYEYIVTRFDS
jgi:HEAT repeat protein